MYVRFYDKEEKMCIGGALFYVGGRPNMDMMRMMGLDILVGGGGLRNICAYGFMM